MKITALLTGRGNNTLLDKNVLPVLGRPLLYYPAYAATKSEHITSLYVSSDDDKILDAAHELGYTKIVRPLEFAQPNSQHLDVIVHALGEIEKIEGSMPDIIIVLLANNGFVNTSWINSCIEKILEDPTISAVVPVYNDQEHHPYRAKKLDENGCLVPFVDLGDAKISTNRQDLTPAFQLSHNFWVLNVQKSVIPNDGWAPWRFMGKKVLPLEISESFDVHTMDDLRRTEIWLSENYEF
jgi:CMP-N,N'-diacetyllegionaminic acid synthase